MYFTDQVALEQVLQRMDDVRTMCDQKRQSLHRIVDRPLRPVQTVYPEPKQIQGLERQCSEDLNYNNKHRDSGRSQLERSKVRFCIMVVVLSCGSFRPNLVSQNKFSDVNLLQFCD